MIVPALLSVEPLRSREALFAIVTFPPVGLVSVPLIPSSAPDALPTEVLVGETVTVSLLRRSGPPPFAEKLVDRHQIRFYDRGRFLLETELGPLTAEVQQVIADYLELPIAHIYGVVTFYTMFHQKPVGKNVLMICTNVSCMLRGGYDILHHVERK